MKMTVQYCLDNGELQPWSLIRYVAPRASIHMKRRQNENDSTVRSGCLDFLNGEVQPRSLTWYIAPRASIDRKTSPGLGNLIKLTLMMRLWDPLNKYTIHYTC